MKAIENMSKAELKEVFKAAKARWALLTLYETELWEPKQEVVWSSSDGSERDGRILRVNQKSVTVIEHGTHCSWRVSPSLLRRVTTARV